VEGVVTGSWSIAEFLRDVLGVSRRIVLELRVEGRMRLRCSEGDDVFVAVVSGGCYAFAVLVLAVYMVGGVVVPLCR
jgi:acyl-CoA synthetase (AMP-forming)/AMP-acid ligase II